MKALLQFIWFKLILWLNKIHDLNVLHIGALKNLWER
jgi:hypothetical protein